MIYPLVRELATDGIFVVVTAIALAVSYAIERKLHAMPLITGAVVLVMGGLTVYFNDERFIKYKPTIVSGLMGSTLLIGWARGKSLIKPLLGSTLELDDAGWRTLTLRWGFFFLVVAGLNELVWRSTTTSVWLNFKLFGILGLTFLFMLLQQPLIQLQYHRFQSLQLLVPLLLLQPQILLKKHLNQLSMLKLIFSS